MFPYQTVSPNTKKTVVASLLADVLAKHSRNNLPVLYLSGPMSGLPRCNFPAFNEAARRLRLLGFPVLNPADFGGEDNSNTYRAALGRDLSVLPHAAIVVLLDGWERSHGSGVEIDVAIGLKIPLVTQRELHEKVLARLFDENELFAMDMLDKDRQRLGVAYDRTGQAFVGNKSDVNRLAVLTNTLAELAGENYEIPEVDDDDV